MSHARPYYGRSGGLRNPFGSTGKKPRPLVLPALPTCYDQVRAGMLAAAARDQADTQLPAVWRHHASVVHNQLTYAP